MLKKRWRLILLVGILAALFAVSAIQGRAGQLLVPEATTQVGMAHSDAWLSDAEVEAMVREAVQLAGGLESVIHPGDVVVIKPNLVQDVHPDRGWVTDPRVTRAVARLAQEAGAGTVTIAEGTAVYVSGQQDRYPTRRAFQVAGYDANGDMVDDATGVQLIDLNISGDHTDATDPAYVTSVTIPDGLIRNQYWIPNPILNCDVLISVPVLKNHYNAGLTLALKNMMGIAPNDIYHHPGWPTGKHSLSHAAYDLPRHIVDLNLCRPIDFVVVDGLRGMTDGPIGSQLVSPPMQMIMAGRDPVAVDTIGALTIGYDPASIVYLDMAQSVGLGLADVSHITVQGRPVSEVRRDFPVPYGDPPAQRAESQPPAVEILSPAEGAVVWGVITVEATASDNVGVAKVEFYVDDVLAETVTDASFDHAQDRPYRLLLDTATLSLGTHTLKVAAYDAMLNQATRTRIIQVAQAPTASPTWTFTPSPTATPTWTPSATPTPTPWPTATTTWTFTPSPTATPTWTPSATPTPTFTVSPTPSHTPPATVTPTPPMPTALTADVNGDGAVNILDLTMMAANFGRTGPTPWLPPGEPRPMHIEIRCITGFVQLQGRYNHSGASILVTEADGTAVAETLTDAAGNFEVQGLLQGTYEVWAKMACYLDATVSGVGVAAGGECTNVGATKLLGGDVVPDGVIDIFDVSYIASRFGSTEPTATL